MVTGTTHEALDNQINLLGGCLKVSLSPQMCSFHVRHLGLLSFRSLSQAALPLNARLNSLKYPDLQ